MHCANGDSRLEQCETVVTAGWVSEGWGNGGEEGVVGEMAANVAAFIRY